MSKQHLEHIDVLDISKQNNALRFVNRKIAKRADRIMTWKMKNGVENAPVFYSKLICFDCCNEIEIGSKYFSRRFPSGMKYWHYKCAARVGRV